MLSRVGSCHCDFGRRRVDDGWEADGYDNGYDSHYEPKYEPHHESSWGGSSSSGSSGSSGSGKSGKSGGKSGKSGGSWSGSGKGGKSGNSSHYGNKCRVTMAITSQILDENTHTRSHNPNRKKSLEDSAASDHNKSEDSLSKRAKGFIPGSQDGENPVNPNMAGVISGMGSPNVGRRLGRAVC